MKGTLFVFEGIDGSGKATQSNHLANKLQAEGKSVMRISFPDYESPSSALVKMYLNGDFGNDPESVNPYAAALFYAVDRFASYKMKWRDFYLSGGIVIADRYTTSNMVHQMTKFDDLGARLDFLSWLEKTEYKELELPTPDMVILLDVPLDVSKKLVRDRAAHGGSMDIHEQHMDYLSRCYEAYQMLCKRYQWTRISCTNNQFMRTEEEIANDVARVADKFLTR